MTDLPHSVSTATRRRRLPSIWAIGALIIAVLVLMPLVWVLFMALTPEDNIWPHLISTTLPRYAGNTVLLAGGVAVLAAVMGCGTAWLIAMYRFPGARLLEWLLLLPLAIPAYVSAYALVDFLEYAGPVQTGLRALFGWETARDYWFPEVRSRGAAILVLASVLYPYVYLLCRAAYREQSGGIYDVARALGAGAFMRFWRVGLPLSRPAIAAGTAIVMMETVSDFGVVEFFAVQTLTTGIFSVWLEAGNPGGAAQIASLVLGMVLLLVALEKIGRNRMRYFTTVRQSRAVSRIHLTGFAGLGAAAVCVLPFAMGFVLPVGVMLGHAVGDWHVWKAPGLTEAVWNTVSVGGIAALTTVLAATFLVYGVRLSSSRLPRLLLPATTLGYAAPGAVLAVGLLIPLAALDNAVADVIEQVTGRPMGLLLTGSAAVLIYAYCIRFFAIAQGAVDAAMGRISPSLPMAARSLGRTPGQTLREVFLPLIRSSFGTALLLVFVDCAKELPATLLLRPFGFDTLATRVYEKASLENIAEASPAALLVMSVSLVAVLILARANRERA
ncbi:iron ABC transporter permease [Actibacterium mucosum KCTC 23349]|uniref:Iron ABC transporter permease n=1 Tax=Actibacterium mucosum KCTC 23349 TaxID=1454373 RepID=A0A037ZK73_9RHOB|nr:iron ABC transporter permease [Actibacterium mucosum]KAJ56034.1 iron ABC transporter permease [Actibacterium mucosum KCTC 23349]